MFRGMKMMGCGNSYGLTNFSCHVLWFKLVILSPPKSLMYFLVWVMWIMTLCIEFFSLNIVVSTEVGDTVVFTSEYRSRKPVKLTKSLLSNCSAM